MSDTVRNILFVCTGNICRSPTAEGVARKKLEEAGWGDLIRVDSAGTHGYHVGEAPDDRTVAAARARGYDLTALRARQLAVEDFHAFDLLLAMDGGHMTIMKRMCPPGLEHKLQMFMQYAHSNSRDELPDPYYGNERGFEIVLSCCEEAVEGLLHQLEER